MAKTFLEIIILIYFFSKIKKKLTLFERIFLSLIEDNKKNIKNPFVENLKKSIKTLKNSKSKKNYI
jgi:hypothetical protein